MKKMFLKVAAILLILCQLVTFLAACEKDPEIPVTPPTTEAPVEAAVSLTKENIGDYVIVVPEGASATMMDAANRLKALIATASGISLTVKSDAVIAGSEKYFESECEILLGKTDREESSSFHKQLRVNDAGFAMIGKKVLLGGHNDDAVARSVTLWNNKHLVKAPDVLMPFDACEISVASYPFHSMSLNGERIDQYRIVYPSSNRFGERELAGVIAAYITERTGYILECVSDRTEAVARELWIGDTNRLDDAALAERNSTGYGDGASYVAARNGSIWLSGNSTKALNASMYHLFSMLTTEDRETTLTVEGAHNNQMTELKLTALTYNILYEGTGRSEEDLLASIRQENADVFGCNEVTDRWMTKLTAAFSEEYDYVQGKKTGGTSGFYNPVFYKKDKFELVESGTLWLSDTPDRTSKYSESNQYRHCVYVILQDRATGVEFVYIQTHLENTGENSHAATARKKQSEALLRNTQRFAYLPVIIGGDFNASNITNVAPLYTGTRFSNGRDLAAQKIGNGTWVGPDFLKITGSTLDYIFVSGGCMDVLVYEAVDNKINNKYPSDHIPVKVEVTIYQ